ncbi:MAG: PKD domain-containing protein, partial [Halobacteriovoraceae bacterium]|nr:PKD domain-containing protein [Halobacteriovoraceae bacterium]
KSGKLYKKNSKDALVLKSSELSLKEIQDALSLKIHNPKTDGSSDGGEMGMYSILEALKDGNLQEIKSKGLFRDDAALAVIFVADEQDICAQAPEGITLKVDPQNGERKSFVKYCIEENLKWKNVNIGGSEYTYKITPQIVLDRLRVVKGEMPLVVGGVLYDEASTIPTGNEDEIGYGYLETVRLAKGINVDLGSGDYRDGLKNLGKLATTSFSAPQSFDLSVNPDETSIKAFVDDILVPHTYDPLANKVFLVDDRDDLSIARIEYCEKDNVNTPPLISLVASPLEGVAPLEVTIDGSGSTDDKEIESFMLEINGEVLTNSTGLFTYTFTEAGEFEALFKVIDTEAAISSESLTFSVAPTPINPTADFTLSKISGRVPFSTVLDASNSTDIDGTIVKYDLSVNGSVTSQTDPIFNLRFNESGSVNLLLTVTDSQGLTSEKSATLQVLPALVAPVAGLSVTPESGRVPLDVTVDASSSTDADGTIVKYDLLVNGNLISQTSPQFSFNVDEEGSYNLVLTVTDSDGLTNSTTKIVSYDPALVAPVAAFKITPEEGRIPQDVIIDASASSDSDGSIVKYDLYVDENLISQSTAIFNLDVVDAKTYNLRLVVTDSDGLTNEVQKSATYLPALIAPVASLTASPSEAEVPFEVTLDASLSTDSDGTIVNYIFSDGTNVVESPSSTLTFIQETPGTYDYTVEIVDNDGLKSTANTQVIAKPKTTDEVSALLAFYKFNLIPSGESFELELLFEGRSLNGKEITEAYYSTPDGTRVDVGRRVLGHKDVI